MGKCREDYRISHCVVCGKPDGGIPWELMPVHPECRKKITSPLSYGEQIAQFMQTCEKLDG